MKIKWISVSRENVAISQPHQRLKLDLSMQTEPNFLEEVKNFRHDFASLVQTISLASEEWESKATSPRDLAKCKQLKAQLEEFSHLKSKFIDPIFSNELVRFLDEN